MPCGQWWLVPRYPATESALMSDPRTTTLAEAPPGQESNGLDASHVRKLMDRYDYSEEARAIVESENLLPTALLNRLHARYPTHSGLKEFDRFLFDGPESYSGLDGFRRVLSVLERNGIKLEGIPARELFVEVYRFKASRHILNTINWNDYENDPMYHLVIPQPGIMKPHIVQKYTAAESPEERTRIALDYIKETNPHDAKQMLNKPWMPGDDGEIEILEGSQHKYPQIQLAFDKTTQSCFSFCTYCFRHAQVRGGDDIFIQEDIGQIHNYLRQHKEVTDLLITGGDAGYLPYDRFAQYVTPILEDPALWHVQTVRIGSRMLTFQPELILSRKYDKMLDLFARMRDNGVQPAWMAHFSTPREVLNPTTIAAIRRLQRHGVVIRSQSPIMNHVSLFKHGDGSVDIERSAQNWVDLGNVLGMLQVGFHSMYCARHTGEHHYFAAPLADIQRISNRVYRSLASINRPSRYITMTISAGKVSILGSVEVGGRRALALKLNEARNMEWMDRVFLAVYDDKQTRVDQLQPFDTDEFFFEEELRQIEGELAKLHNRHVAEPEGRAAAHTGAQT